MLITVIVDGPAAALMDVLCEHTWELARDVPLVAAARLQRRDIDAAHRVASVQLWQARVDVPELLQPHLPLGLTDWCLRLERQAGALECSWRIEPLAAQWPLRCHGTLACRPALGGRGTRIELRASVGVGGAGVQAIAGRLLAAQLRGLAAAASRRVSAALPAS